MKKFLCFLALVISIVCCICVLSSCSLEKPNDNIENEPEKAVPTNNLVFGYGVDKEDLYHYFVEHGKQSSSLDNATYVIHNTSASIYYYPQDNKFSIVRKIVKNSTISNVGDEYKWMCGIDIKLWDLVSNSIFAGIYEHSAINLNTLNVVLEYAASFEFNINNFVEINNMSDFSTVKFTSAITSADNYAKAKKHFKPKQEGKIIYEQFQVCLNAIETIFKSINDANLTSEYNSENYQSIDFSNVVFENDSLTIDTDAHSIFVKNAPTNVLIEYEGNNQSAIGNHIITAKFKDPKGIILFTITARLDITDIFNVTIQYVFGKDIISGFQGHLINTQQILLKYGANILEQCVFPENYVYKDTSNTVFPESYAWSGYCDQNVTVSVTPKYKGYVYVESSVNAYIDKQIIPIEDTSPSYGEYITTIPYGEKKEILFKLSDIEKIKIFNTNYISETLIKAGNSDIYYMENLHSIDLSECAYLERIPNYFFSGHKNLNTIVAPKLPYLKFIGASFLQGTNIIDFNFDMTNVEEINRGFLTNALAGIEDRTISINLKSIKKILGNDFLYSSEYLGKPIVNVYLYDFIMQPIDFNQKTYCNLYMNNQVEYFNKLFNEHPNIHVYQMSSK